ncbi:MAG: amidohydrolase family protein, partial [Rubrobacter sp.]|nr:amidohydrolase family protein [Rubrobacter sp.]
MPKAYTAARVIDGVSERAIENGAVTIENNLISSVGPAADLPPSTETIDLGNMTLLPGLIDAHVHLVWSASAEPHDLVARESRALTVLRCARNAALHLAAGVTTVRDVGATGALSVEVARAVE